MHDSASVNGAAMSFICLFSDKCVDMNCLAHTMDLVGKALKLPEADEVINLLLQIHTSSEQSREVWRVRFGKKPRSVSQTRWWSKWEFMCSVLSSWDGLLGYISDLTADKLCTNYTSSLNSALTTEMKRKCVHLQLKVASVLMKKFVLATYNLEGDSFLLPFAYDLLLELCSLANDPSYFLSGQGVECTDEVRVLVQPAMTYFQERMKTDCASRLPVFKLARLFNPIVVNDLNVTVPDIRSLAQAFPFIDSETIDGLLTEWNSYVTMAASFNIPPTSTFADKVDAVWKWWSRQLSIPIWRKVAAEIALIQPSSAAAERAFSLLRHRFGKKQKKSLMDYVETSVMVAYNKNEFHESPLFTIDDISDSE
jgi:hypothetical protein